MKTKLYKPFEHWYHGGTIWLYSDPHFGDGEQKLIDPLWPDDASQVKALNHNLSRNDTIIFLGDIGDVEFIKEIKGYKVLLLGNHDRGASNYLKEYLVYAPSKDFIFKSYNKMDAEDVAAEYNILEQHDDEAEIYSNGLFDEVYEGPLMINNHIMLSHEPIDMGFGINIHGHNHTGYRLDRYLHSISINVCSNIIDFEKVRLDKLLENIEYEDIHRMTIDNATRKQRTKIV